MNSSHCWIENSHTFNIRADFSYHLSMSQIQFIFSHRIEMAKQDDAYKLLTQLPHLYLIPREGAGVDAGVRRAHGVRDF